METNQTAALDPRGSGETCDGCDAPLMGSLIVTSGVIGQTGFIRILEASERNWILCDSCNTMLCHECAPRFQTGYCEDCIREFDLKFDDCGRLL